MTIRVRFAPSPTGYLHVGGARTALFNWLCARHHGGVFVLRIEDTDRARSRPEHTEVILSALRWLGLDWDEGPFFQSDGVDRHRGAALRLLEAGQAYRDFTTAEELAQAREAAKGVGTDVRLPRRRAEAMPVGEAEERAGNGEAHAIRFLVPDGETVWDDMVHEEMRFQNATIDDLVILRSDGSPIYNLAVASDDAKQSITHVIRGDDHLSNTPKQILLSEALGHSIPTFGHVPMILGSDGKRLSKRHGATAVGEYEGQGILPEAMANFLALLGWSPGGDLEVMAAEDLVQRFGMDRVLKKSSVFDLKKLDWLSGQYFNSSTAEALEPAVTDGIESAGLATRAELEERRGWYLSLVDLLKTRARTMPGLVDLARPFLVDELEFDPEAVAKYWLKAPDLVLEQLTVLRARLEGSAWEPEMLEEVIRGYAEELSVGAGKIIHPLRVAVTGREVSPGIFDVLAFLGRRTVLSRLDGAIARLEDS